MAGERESLDPAILAGTAESLRQRGDAAGGFAAPAVTRAGEAYGWWPVCRDPPHGLREHPDAEVAGAAYARTTAAR